MVLLGFHPIDDFFPDCYQYCRMLLAFLWIFRDLHDPVFLKSQVFRYTRQPQKSKEDIKVSALALLTTWHFVSANLLDAYCYIHGRINLLRWYYLMEWDCGLFLILVINTQYTCYEWSWASDYHAQSFTHIFLYEGYCILFHHDIASNYG